MLGLLSEVNSRIEYLHRSKSGFTIDEKYSDEWLMFNASNGNTVERKILENEYTMLSTLRWIYFKQVKTLKELEQMKDK